MNKILLKKKKGFRALTATAGVRFPAWEVELLQLHICTRAGTEIEHHTNHGLVLLKQVDLQL